MIARVNVRIGSIYKITNRITNESYIGKTQRTLQQRMREHCKKNSCTRLYRAINKYGKHNFIIEEIYIAFDVDTLNSMEIFFIKQQNTLSPNGYNLTLGGEGSVFCKEVRDLISKRMKGVDRSNLNKEVVRICVKTHQVTIFPSLKSTSENEYKRRSIRAVCNNERNNYTHDGYYWVYKCDYDNFKIPTYKTTGIKIVQYDVKNCQVILHNSLESLMLVNLSTVEIKKCCNNSRLCYDGSFWFYEQDYSIDNLTVKLEGLRNPFLVLNLDPDTKGYYKHKPTGLYCAKIKIKGQSKSLGYFKTPEEARSAYISELGVKSTKYLNGEL